MLIVTLFACSSDLPAMADNSLEAAGLPADGETLEADGVASVVEGAEGDWSFNVGGTDFVWHSASRADLSSLDGRQLRAEAPDTWGTRSARVLEDDAPVLVASVGDGSEAFGREVWTFGEAVGEGEVVNEYDEPTAVVFHEVVVHADDGEVVLLPGEPTRVVIDGATFRATVVAAYTIAPTDGEQPGCGPSDLLSIELFRTEAAEDEAPLARPGDRLAPMSSCG